MRFDTRRIPSRPKRSSSSTRTSLRGSRSRRTDAALGCERAGRALASSRIRSLSIGCVSSLRRKPAVAVLLVHLLEDPANVVLELPCRVVGLEGAVVPDPPNVVPDTIGLLVHPGQLLAGNLFAGSDRLEDRGIAESPASDVVDLGKPRSAKVL